jgi:hypothetical protein
MLNYMPIGARHDRVFAVVRARRSGANLGL